MITNLDEYTAAQSELCDLQNRLNKLQVENPIGKKGLTKAGLRK